ncbi:Fur family transcriptional regulator [Streptomyces caniscabiei]|uniref:Fur family transcriptional regulator n=1 Tax=Streptomyces caniscabiei TaxID=2746961 RepID=UPI0029AC6966|nr:Fur family transcriptional regulator [Streptomyces caniscabiei]MDX2776156.1 Fur family transcriptional regulator [Streptomyces caniscabiei]
MNPDIRAVLTRQGLRVTSPRLAVFKALANTATPLGVTDIIKACPAVDKVSIYRTIETFTRIGVTTVIMHGWKQRYELADPFRPHHHHLHCTKCDTVIEIHSDEIESVIKDLAQQYAFQPVAHTFEISGLCQSCATRQAD